MVRLQGVEQLRNPFKEDGRGQQSQRMTGRRRVDDDHVVAVGGNTRNLEQPDDLIDPGQRQLEQTADIFFVEIGAAKRDCGQQVTPRGEPSIEGARGVEIHGAEAGHSGDRARHGGYAHTQDITERGGRIGRDEQRAIGARRLDRECGRARGFADATLATDQRKRRKAEHRRRKYFLLLSSDFRPGSCSSSSVLRPQRWLRCR